MLVKYMEPIWKNLPRDILPLIFRHLNAAIRRDLGCRPRRLENLPSLNLHHDALFYDQTYTALTLHTNEWTTYFIWETEGASLFQRYILRPFMNVNGIRIMHSEEVSNELTWRS